MSVLVLEKDLKKTLSNEEIQALFQEYRNGSDIARCKLIESNEGLIRYCIKNLINNPIYDEKDLFSVGKLGLICAIETYDSSKNSVFSRYAFLCIKNAIFRFISYCNKHRLVESLDVDIPNTDGLTLGDAIMGSEDVSITYEEKYQREVIKNIIMSLPEKNRKIILLKYWGNYSQSDIAKMYGCTRQGISKIVLSTYKKIKKELLEQHLFDERNKIK